MTSFFKEIVKHEISGLSSEDLDDFTSLWNIEKKITRGNLLNPKGKVEQHLYFVQNGSLKICYDIEDQEMIVGFGYPNSFIFDLPSFFTEKPSNFYIEAIKSCTLIGIRKQDFLNTVKNNTVISDYWQQKKSHIILGLIEREIDLLTLNPEERFQRLFLRSPEVFQHVPNKYIAQYLRMAPETLSRLKKS